VEVSVNRTKRPEGPNYEFGDDDVDDDGDNEDYEAYVLKEDLW
jgi:hypothetical protein